jgi:hypothetical protein
MLFSNEIAFKVQSGTHVKPLCVGKELWPSSSMANIVIQLWRKY